MTNHPNRKREYMVETSRREAALYLAKEYGIARAVHLLRDGGRLVKVDGPWVFLGNPMFHRGRKEAENFKRRVEIFVAYQQGRLRIPLTGGNCYLEAAI